MMQAKRGFSLVEILLALLILGIGIVTLFNLFPLGFQALAYSRRLNEVSLLAQKKMEELKSG
ncbi:MAG: prepilin-type N-terminal cleavage/methylation domain-containing protein [Candidatus Omnitrophica bacterium]|nr:prepilin-type N-terminal cleavage/methylation domain-containing protein [Candidatus Omnitrophota bacterium]